MLSRKQNIKTANLKNNISNKAVLDWISENVLMGCFKFSIISLTVICLYISGCKRQQKAPPQMTPEVSTITVSMESVTLYTELPGRTSAYMIAEIRPQVNGIIEKRLFTEGSEVKSGQVLYKIDSAPFEAALDNAKANLAVAKESANRARAALEASIANIARQKSTLDLAKSNLKRIESLYKENVIPESQRDQAVTETEVAEAALKAVEAQVESDKKAVTAAEAVVKQAEAAVKTAKINLGYTSIKAPISGRIGKSNVTEGALVIAYQGVPLTTIQQLDPIYVDVIQSTTELLQLRRRLNENGLKNDEANQNKVKLILEDNTEYSLDGELQFRDITVDQLTGSYTIRIVFPNPDSILLPGMFVRAKILEGINEQAILIPQQALLRNPKGEPMAMIVGSGGKIEQRMLTIDRAIGNKWLVSSGLTVGEHVVVEGIQKVRHGVAVKEKPFVEGEKQDEKHPNPPNQSNNKTEGGK